MLIIRFTIELPIRATLLFSRLDGSLAACGAVACRL
jgi:hypothetical protein